MVNPTRSKANKKELSFGQSDCSFDISSFGYAAWKSLATMIQDKCFSSLLGNRIRLIDSFDFLLYFMLCLLNNTRPEWVDIAAADIDTLLIDHAHCEKKAAYNALTMIQNYPEHEDIVKEMIIILKEEWDHFERVYERIRNKGLILLKDSGNEYAKQLSKHIRKHEPEKMLDLLLIDGLIEARSCERFSLLAKSESISQDLRDFYQELFASEAGHYRTFTDLARKYFPADIVKQRMHELAMIEAKIMDTLGHQPTMHG